LPLSPQRWLKNANWPCLPVRRYFSGRKSAAKFLCVETVSGKVVRLSLAQMCTNVTLLPEIFHQSDSPRSQTAISTVRFDFEGVAYLRLVYHIHSTPVCHMCQCNTYFLALMSNSREKLLYSLSIYSLSPRCVYKHLVAVYNEMGTMGTNQ